MKKLIIGLLIGIFIAVPGSAMAWSLHQQATPTFGTACDRNPDSNNNACDVIVDRYKDGSNVCYIARNNVGPGRMTGISLSCVATK